MTLVFALVLSHTVRKLSRATVALISFAQKAVAFQASKNSSYLYEGTSVNATLKGKITNVLGQIRRHELFTVLGLVEEIFVNFLAAEDPNVGVVSDRSVRQPVHVCNKKYFGAKISDEELLIFIHFNKSI